MRSRPWRPRAGRRSSIWRKLNDKVKAGLKAAIERDSFGEVIAENPRSAWTERSDWRQRTRHVMSEPGNPLVFILFNNTAPGTVEVYPE